MRATLIKLHLWPVVENPNAKDSKDLAGKDDEALAHIGTAVADPIIPTILSAKSAHDAWRKLEDIYEPKTVDNEADLLRAFWGKRMKEEDDVIPHITEMRRIASQLAGIGHVMSESTQAMAIMTSMPKSYTPVLRSLEKHSLTVDLLQSRLIQEQKMARQQEGNEEPRILHAKKSNRKPCSHCKRFGHIEKDCYVKNGLKCGICGRPHPEKTCKSKPSEKPENAEKDSSKQRTACVASTQSNKPVSWYLDSAASCHMCCDKNEFVELKALPNEHINWGNSAKVRIEGIGKVRLFVKDDLDGIIEVELDKVYYVPDFNLNLISIGILDKKGVRMHVQDGEFIVTAGEARIVGKRTANNLYQLTIANQNKAMVAEISEADVEKWHRRLGHLNKDAIKEMISHELAIGWNIKKGEECESCLKGKIIKRPYESSKSKASKRLELIHADLVGPMESSRQGSKYILTLVDDFSRYTAVYGLKSKDETFTKFKQFKALVENQLNEKIKKLRTDGGGEFVNREMENLLAESGIEHQITCAYTPQQNGRAERSNRTLVECARSMLQTTNLSTNFWLDAVETAVYLKNRSVHSAIKKTPLEIWTGNAPDISNLRVFGCMAYVLIPDQKRTKFMPKAEKCTFIGYEETRKGWKFYSEDKKIIFSREARFLEEQTTTERPEVDSGSAPERQEMAWFQPKNSCTKCERNFVEDDNEEFWDALEHVEETMEDDWIAQIDNRVFAFASKDPETYSQAIESTENEEWKDAIKEELRSMDKNEVYELVDLPPNRKAIKSKWVFKKKTEADGSTKFKARFVAKGYSQEFGVDYFDTYAPVMHMTTLRVLLSYAAANDYHIEQMDVKTAFLYGELHEEIYLEPPEGTRADERKVWKLKKAIYGLKQAPKQWNMTLGKVLQKMKFEKLRSDEAIFRRMSENPFIIASYVDDLLLICESMEEIEIVKQNLKASFEMKDLGPVQRLLGMQIKRDRKRRLITLSQSEYIKETLEKFKMTNAKSVATPIEVGGQLNKDMCPKTNEDVLEMSRVPYRSAVGSVMFLMTYTRPDIAFAVGQVSKFLDCPGNAHWIAVKRILRYLVGTTDLNLQLGGSLPKIINGYCDADWGGDRDDRKSTSGYIFTFGGAVSWKSKKQAIVAQSSAEAEYISASEAGKESVWIQALLKEIGYEIKTKLHCDNQSCISIMSNTGGHNRTKHIDVRYHFIKDLIEQGGLTVQYLSTNDMLADPLTKGISKEKLRKFMIEVGLTVPSLKGRVENQIGTVEWDNDIQESNRTNRMMS